jgi:hypothetical protein
MVDRDTLRAQVMAAPWVDLRDHHARGALLLLASEEDLIDVGLAIARDDRATVSALLARGALRKTSESEAKAFAERTSTRFQLLIVQPFVLAQQLPSAGLC